MKSWTSLRSSLDRLGREAAQIQLVEQDVGKLRADLTAQEQLWQQAGVQLEGEKTALRVQLEGMRAQVQADTLHDPQLEAEVDALQKQSELAKIQLQKQQRDFDGWKAQADVQRRLLQVQRQQLLSQLLSMNATAEEDARKARREQGRLQAEAKALRLRGGELQQRLQEVRETLQQEEQLATSKVAALRQQAAELEVALNRTASGLQGRESLAQELTAMQQRLRAVTSMAVQVRQEQAELVSRCGREGQARSEVFSGEQDKAAIQGRETLQTCGEAHGRHGLLRQMLLDCQARGSSRL
eukprot:CAMPEP_0175676118 /NCGR_PEP_ID=MMETSP0097-20121207/22580_1 /TAXON_ID=311494 /ORGANISM="Alexandrium monilatum, Strain CCMP3105" /LENGTH=297 /DNA_ID=CAMNT_0016982853 /DNA_START=11 /DNA_END=904 /DNA_ORIENTATION=-